MSVIDENDQPRFPGDWRRGFEQAGTGLDCRQCGARIGQRPELAERHRRWHRELTEALESEYRSCAHDHDR